MKYGIYSIRDQLVGFGRPTIQINDEAAIRDFSILVNGDPNTAVSLQPQYFDFYRIGEFDDNTGDIKVEKSGPKLLVTGLTVKKGDNGTNEEV